MALEWLSIIYISAAAGLALFGLLGLTTLIYFIRHRKETTPCPEISTDSLPTVTVQLPIYNECYVVQRLIDSVACLDYPRDKLAIQVVDDSTDETTDIAAYYVARYHQLGIDIELLHRSNRVGYKAGALEEATRSADGEFIAVFDADFVPEPDFLLKTVPHFMNEPSLGMVQARWGHLNMEDSSLTAAQTIAVDKHFVMEQTVRHRANFYPKFNGSAGVWRRTTIIDSGGWQADTVCEDLCLSTRAILKGWKFRFLNNVVAPAELPSTLTAYKNQQARWAKGSTQCLIRFGRPILLDKNHSPLARGYALLSMAGYINHLFLLILLLVQVPLIAAGFQPPIFFVAFGLLGLSQPILFIMGQQTIYKDWKRRLWYFPTLLIIAIGLAPVNSRAIFSAITGQKNVFVRTPKGQVYGGKKAAQDRALPHYQLPFDWIVLIELFLALYAAVGLSLCIINKNIGPAFFLATCTVGFGYVAVKSIQEKVLQL
jgi:cellulose synthase/poly-beta-1,6-N-acetylglucosamine synthase-like glycosyltransferase